MPLRGANPAGQTYIHIRPLTMRILLTYVTVGRGGDAVQWLALADALRRRGHDVTVAGGHAIAPYTFNTAGARLRGMARRLPWWTRDLFELGLTVMAAWKACRAGRARRAELVIHRASVCDFAAGAVARALRVPLVLYLDAHVAAERRFRGEAYWHHVHAWAMRTMGRAAALIVTPSRVVADYYREMGLPAERIAVHRNGVRERHLRLGLDAAETHAPCADRGVCTIGFAGSLSAWHRVDLLLDALRLLHDEQERSAGGAPEPAYRLVIIGRGGDYDRLREHARRLALGAAVEWRGPLPHDDAVLAMRGFDIAVLPHTLPTGSPMKLAEYAAMARPIIAPDVPNIRDMFSGLEITLVRPGDARALAAAIRRLAADPPLAQQMGRAAQARMLGYTWEETVDLVLREAFAEQDGASRVFATARKGPGPEVDAVR